MRIRLTEVQAWETLARFFKDVKDFRQARGLCFQIQNLAHKTWISQMTANQMRWYIERTDAWRESSDGYLWPCDAAGAKPRARFCWRQVRRLKGKK